MRATLVVLLIAALFCVAHARNLLCLRTVVADILSDVPSSMGRSSMGSSSMGRSVSSARAPSFSAPRSAPQARVSTPQRAAPQAPRASAPQARVATPQRVAPQAPRAATPSRVASAPKANAPRASAPQAKAAAPQRAAPRSPKAATPSKAAPATPAKPSAYKVNHQFIAKLEGMKLGMYVPTKNGKAIGKSGPTIANGLDLGQRNNMKDLKANGLSPAIANKLTPYLGMKKDAAISFVKSHPLTLSKAEGTQLANAVSKTYDANVARSFNKVGNTKFSSLPGNVQTALASVAHQYGSFQANSNIKSVAQAAQRGDYNAAARALQSMPGYSSRRKQEASMMRA